MSISQPYIKCAAGLLLFLSILTCSCQSGRAKTNKGTAISSPANAEMPSTAKDSDSVTTLPLSAGDTAKVISFPATPQSPAHSETIYTLSRDTVLTHKASSSEVSVAPPRAPDKSVELFKAAAQERRWLLFVGIACGIAGIASKSLMPAWPGVPRGLFLASGLAIAAWKLSEIPAWIWAVAIAVSVLLALGYKRAESDKKSGDSGQT